jgi:ferredoxin-thioredoxin reductase catalytic subunit
MEQFAFSELSFPMSSHISTYQKKLLLSSQKKKKKKKNPCAYQGITSKDACYKNLFIEPTSSTNKKL